MIRLAFAEMPDGKAQCRSDCFERNHGTGLIPSESPATADKGDAGGSEDCACAREVRRQPFETRKGEAKRRILLCMGERNLFGGFRVHGSGIFDLPLESTLSKFPMTGAKIV